MRGMKKGVWVIGGASFVVMMIGAALATPRVLADTASGTDDITLTLDVACTVSSTVTIPHDAPDMHVGQHKVDIGNTDISLFCNDNNGYSVYAIGNSGDMDGATDLVSDISDNYNIHTGTNTTGNSAWAMKLTAGTGSASETTPPTIVNGYDSYSAVPDVYTQVAKRTSGTSAETNTKVSGSYFSTTYSIYAASTQPAGSYAGKVKYVMVHPSSNATTIPDIDAAFAAKGKQKAYQDASGNYYYSMQDMSSDICASVTRTGESTTARLVDVRDNKLYYVTKLKDGHCWMTQNLDLDLSPDTALTSNDTDLNDNSMAGAYGKDYSYDATNNVISWTPQNTTKHSATGAGTNWANSYNVAYSLDPGEWYWDGDDSTPNCNYLNASAGCTHFTQDRTNANRHLSVGNYYNWSAAIASDDSSSLTNSTYGSTSDPDAINRNPQNSICPKGWRLPTISYKGNVVNSTSEFARVNGLYNDGITNNDKKLIESPLWFVRSGYVNFGNLYGPGSGASYWSSTVSSSDSAYNLYFAATTVNPANYYNDRSIGWSVRCVAR